MRNNFSNSSTAGFAHDVGNKQDVHGDDLSSRRETLWEIRSELPTFTMHGIRSIWHIPRLGPRE